MLRRYLLDACVDLVYLDPPFNSNRNYNVIFRDELGNARYLDRALELPPTATDFSNDDEPSILESNVSAVAAGAP